MWCGFQDWGALLWNGVGHGWASVWGGGSTEEGPDPGMGVGDQREPGKQGGQS